MSGLIWIQTVCHSDGIPERNFRKKSILKIISRGQTLGQLPSMQRVKAYEPVHAKTSNNIPAKTQTNPATAWSESASLICVRFDAYGPSFIHAHGEDSDQTGRIAYTELSLTGRKSFFFFWGGGEFYSMHRFTY